MDNVLPPEPLEKRFRLRAGEAMFRHGLVQLDGLMHLQRWGIADLPAMKRVWDVSESRTKTQLRVMHQAGLIGKARFSSSPVVVIHMTKAGHELLMAHRGEVLAEQGLGDFRPPIYPSTINEKQIAHELLAAEAAAIVVDWIREECPDHQVRVERTGPEMRASEFGYRYQDYPKKIPDALVTVEHASGHEARWAVELQESYESTKVKEHVLWVYSHALRAKAIDGLYYFSTIPALAESYRTCLESIRERDPDRYGALAKQLACIGLEHLRNRYYAHRL